MSQLKGLLKEFNWNRYYVCKEKLIGNIHRIVVMRVLVVWKYTLLYRMPAFAFCI